MDNEANETNDIQTDRPGPAPRLAPKRRRLVWALVAPCLSALAVWALWRQVGARLDVMAEHWRQADKGLLLLAFAVSALWHVGLGADKWYRILRRLGAACPWLEVVRVRMGSDPIRFVMPLKTGEIVNAAWFYRRGWLDFPRSASSVVFDKALNLCGTLFWLFAGLVALAFHSEGRLGGFAPNPRLAALVALGAVFFALMAFEVPRAWAVRLAARVHPLAHRLAEGGLAPFRELSVAQKRFFVLYGVLFQLQSVVVLCLLFVAYGQRPTAGELIAFGAVATLMSNLPLTSGGIGTREAAVAWLFAGHGDASLLISVGLWLSFAMQVLPALLGAPLAPRVLRVAVEAIDS